MMVISDADEVMVHENSLLRLRLLDLQRPSLLKIIILIG